MAPKTSLIGLAATLLAASSTVLAQAPLEPSSGVLFGAWLDTAPDRGDSPTKFNTRMGHPASFFQLAEDLPLNFNLPPPVEIIKATGTDAIFYLTIYADKNGTTATGMEAYTKINVDDVVNELAKQIGGFVRTQNFRMFIRLLPEMNGSWNPWGQRPVAFVSTWRKIVTAVRNALPADVRNRVAFVWAPSVAATRGGSYPWPSNGYTPFTNQQQLTRANAVNATEFAALDTNNDGVLSSADDPYSPYYPGDEYVDWVGLSIYYYGVTFPWENNVSPPDTAFIEQLTGTVPGGGSNVNFYDRYCTGTHNKPFMVTETAAAFHEYLIAGNKPIPPGPGNLAIKQAYWRQYITNKDLFAKYPKYKAVCLFEFQKDEETTFRDFQVTNDTAILAAFKADIGQSDVIKNLIFAGSNSSSGGGSGGSGSGGGSNDAVSNGISGLATGLGTVLAGMWAMLF
ncbi:hypothetical protein HK104_001309 [Borealophlyctis nickersoniae]|nr:hypothetical protein HK104_001309 [Borealophlyctis nickersoniae]